MRNAIVAIAAAALSGGVFAQNAQNSNPFTTSIASTRSIVGNSGGLPANGQGGSESVSLVNVYTGNPPFSFNNSQTSVFTQQPGQPIHTRTTVHFPRAHARQR